MSRNSSEIFPNSKKSFPLGICVFNLESEELCDENGDIVPLREQSLHVLFVLAENHNETVSKDKLIEAVWTDTFVTDDSLVQCISEIRKAIGDSDHKIIQTFAKKGYRLNTLSVTELNEQPSRGKLTSAILVAICACVIVAISVKMFWTGVGEASAPVIAVMAFDDLSNGDDKGFLSDAISEGIITELSRFGEIAVIARNSSFKYRGKPVDVRLIADELGAHYVLEGSQQKDGQHLRITVQLIDAQTGKHIWADSFDREMADIFSVQSEIVQTVASSVGYKLAYNLPPSGGLDSFTALRYHLEGRTHFASITKDSMKKAGELNLKAIEADPNSVYGYLGMAYVHRTNFLFGWSELSRDETIALAAQYAEKALQIDPDYYLAHHARGIVHNAMGEMELATIRYKKSIALNPNSPNVNMALATNLIYQGKAEEALKLVDSAMKIHPHHPQWFFVTKAFGLWAIDDCKAAMASLQEMATTPSFARLWLTTIQICLDLQSEAEATIALVLEERPTYSLAKEREAKQPKFSDPILLTRWLSALRKAGLPEK